MTGIQNDASLRGKVKAVAKRYAIRPQEVLQMYLFEHFLLRLSRSDYADRFVLKGGLLVSALTGIANRTTMDMDTTVTGLDMDEASIVKTVNAICSTPAEDDMTYHLERMEPIREVDEYANWRAHIRVRYGRIDAPIKLDITTGDAIVPGQVSYGYPLMFKDGTIDVMAYPLVTVLAEKLETVVRRGTANTRGRDFYDIFVLMKLEDEPIDSQQLQEALAATAERRGSMHLMADYRRRLEEIRSSRVMRESVWERYAASAPYAKGIGFDEVVDAACRLAGAAMGNESAPARGMS